jgi:hypothetical protein
MSGIRYRPGGVADVRNAIPLLAPERNCFTGRVWEQLPDLIADLLAHGLAKNYVIEETATGRLRWFGLSAFPAADAMRAALDRPLLPFRDVLLQAALDGRLPLTDCCRQCRGRSVADCPAVPPGRRRVQSTPGQPAVSDGLRQFLFRPRRVRAFGILAGSG